MDLRCWSLSLALGVSVAAQPVRAAGLSSQPTTHPGAAVIAGLKPLFDFPVRDTCVCLADGVYYLTGTTGAPTWWKTNNGIRIWKSKDLKNWEPLGLVWSFEKDATWQKKVIDGHRAIWAPELHHIKDTFWIAYCVNWPGGGTGILKSTTGKAEGPYVDVKPDGPLTKEIDASLFQDDDGKVYFVYQNGKIARMKDDMSGLAEEPRLLTPANAPHVGFEGAFLFKANGRYHLSCAEFLGEDYHCMIASADKLAGPYSNRYLAIPHGGHNMFFRDKTGRWWSTFFGNSGNAPFRERPAILRVDFDADGHVRPLASNTSSDAEQRLIDAPPPVPYRVWRSTPPTDCPFPQSDQIAGIGFTGRHAEYTQADTWYPSWAADGNMYSPFTDGTVNGVTSMSVGESATTGHAKIVGDDPLKLQVVEQGLHKAAPAPYGGRYPCGSLVHDGIWYYGTYCLADETAKPGPETGGLGYNWGVLGPFVGFRISRDFGKTWTQTPHTPARPLFPEPAEFRGKVKIGSPHFVDFGRNMEHSPDGKAYLVAHGAVDPDPKPRAANLSWITGDQIYLLRVTPSAENVNDASKYEFFAGHDEQRKPIWTSDFAKIKPLIDWNNHCGCVTMTYDAPLKRYLMCITDGWPTVCTFDTYVLESDAITGPWRLVTYMAKLGEQAYFVNLPSKFISGDGRAAWLCCSANFTNGWLGRKLRSDPPGVRYGMCLQEIRLLSKADPVPTSPLVSDANVARQAIVTVSSTYAGYAAEAAVDGVVDGYPRNTSHEWASAGEAETAMLRLTWPQEQTIDRVWLFDRPNGFDRITAGMLIFSDGSTICTGPLPDDAQKGLEVRFPPKKARWLIFAVTNVKPGCANVGLSEIAVFRVMPEP